MIGEADMKLKYKEQKFVINKYFLVSFVYVLSKCHLFSTNG